MTALLEPPVLVTSSRSTGPRKRVLLVAYCFPPVGGAGVQRPVKWVKYLERQGWDVTVLTPANPSVPVLDESLLAEIPAGTAFVRPKTWEPSYATKHQLAAKPGEQPGGWSPLRSLKRGLSRFAKACLQPDPQILWYPNAVAAGSRALRQTPHDAILCTAPPYTSFLVGRTLKQRFGLPLVLDYRDEWDLSSEYLEHAPRDRWSRWVQERQQQAVLRAADAVVATTQASVDRLGTRLDTLGHAALRQCIYNGYDDEDFDEHYLDYGTLPTTDRFRLVYTGTLWNLTDVAPVVAAIEQLHDRTPKLAARLEFVAIGRKTSEQQALLGRLSATACRVISRDYCEHSQVLAWQQSADALCLLLSDVPGAERVVPAKLFEYLANRRALLGVTPTGETASILERFHPDGRFAPADVAGICRWLQRQLTMDHEPAETYSRNDLREFSRERQTARLASLLDQLTAARSAGGRS